MVADRLEVGEALAEEARAVKAALYLGPGEAAAEEAARAAHTKGTRVEEAVEEGRGAGSEATNPI